MVFDLRRTRPPPLFSVRSQLWPINLLRRFPCCELDRHYSKASMMCLALIITPLAVMWDLWRLDMHRINQDFSGKRQSFEYASRPNIHWCNLSAGLGFRIFQAAPYFVVRFMAAKDAKVMPSSSMPHQHDLAYLLPRRCSCSRILRSCLFYFAAHTDVAAPVVANHERVFMDFSPLLYSAHGWACFSLLFWRL